MDGHWAPDAHDEELHEKRTCNEAHVVREYVRWDESASDDASDYHGESSAGECGDIPQYSPADDGTDLADA